MKSAVNKYCGSFRYSHQILLCHRQSRFYSKGLAEVGRLEEKQPLENCYPAGQTFLHQVFGYRGVILFPWLARVQSFTQPPNTSECESHNHGQTPIRNPKDDEAKNHRKNSIIYHPYYQVLMDIRDCPFVSSWTQTEAVTFLDRPFNSKCVYSIKGLDYVAHEDIIPYTSHETKPIQHELYSKLFSRPELLNQWRNKHPWLELSRVYRETTDDIRVTVIPFYLGHTFIQGRFYHCWRYCVRLENSGDMSVQLRERNWKIYSRTDMLRTIKGKGVVGTQPVLSKREPAFQYSSQVNLEDESGCMWGTYVMEREDGRKFECRIPAFSLESSANTVTPPTSKRP